MFRWKHEVLEESDKLAKGCPGFRWLNLVTGVWLDQALRVPGLLGNDVKGRKVENWSGGKNEFTCTTLPYVARRLIGCLRRCWGG